MIEFHEDWRTEWCEYVNSVPRDKAPLVNIWSIGRDAPKPYPRLPVEIPICMVEFILNDEGLRQSYIDIDVWFKKEVEFDVYGEEHPMYSEKPVDAFGLQSDFYSWCTWKIAKPVNWQILSAVTQTIADGVIKGKFSSARSKETVKFLQSGVYGHFFSWDCEL